jgi:hypothetical protein
VYWADTIGGKTEKIQIELKPFGYRMAPVTQWKTLIADEDIYVEMGKPTIIKVKTIEIPENTIIGPLNIMRHALGCVVDVVECGIPEKVEEDKCISQVLFMPIESGEVKKGDLVGVLKVFFIRTGLLSRLFGLRPPKVELREEIVEANLTWRDNGNIYRESFKTEVFGYTRSHIGVWELLIADETVRVKAGELTRIKIKELKLPPNTVVVPLGIMRNAYGSVLDVVQLGKPSKVEEEKTIHQAIFLPIEDGKIEEGDLIGVINVYYVGVSDAETVLREKEPEKVNMVYRSGMGIIRKEVTIEPFGYKRSPTASWEILVANENKKVRYGEPCVVSVKKIKLPKNTVIYPLSIMRHTYGTFIDVYLDGPPKRVEEEDRVISKVIFLPIMDGEISEGELLGVLNIYGVEVSALGKVKQWLDNWLNQMGEAFAESDWPMW